MEQPQEGAAAAPARRTVGGYELLHVLGSGGMGTVYEALDADGRRVALKLLHPGFSADEAARMRLRREVATLHRVRGPQVARVLDAEVDSDEAFVVTELIVGESLDTSIRLHGPMDASELEDLARGLAAALEQIHGVGVVHRDMKPGNVMLTDEGPVVIDFGISQVADDARLTQTGLVTGTPGYVDPQVLAGSVPAAGGDWWGWAAVLTFAATGRAPFGTGPLSAVLARVETGRVDVEGLSPLVAQVLRRALHPDPSLRMSHISVLTALDDHVHGRELTELVQQEVSAPGVVPPDTLPPSYRPDAGAGAIVGATEVVDPWVAQRPASAARAPDLASTQRSEPAQVHRPPDWSTQQPVRGAHHVQPRPAASPEHGSPLQDWPAWAIPARSRPGITLAWWLAAVGAGMLWPGWTLILLGAVMVVGGTVGSSARALRNRRLRHGPRRSDVAVASIATPVHVLLAMLLLVPGAVVGILGGGILWGLLSPSGVTPGVLLVVIAVTTLLVWWTPSSNTAREGVWAILDVLAPSKGSVWVWILTGLAVATATGAAVFLADPTPVWAPLPVPPIPSFVS